MPTPFYDHLMSMIDATALDNRRAARGHDVDAASRPVLDWWSARPLVVGTAGLLVIAAVGRMLVAAEVNEAQPPVAAAQTERALEGSSRPAGNASMHEQAESPAAGREPGGSGSAGMVAARATRGAGDGRAVAERSDGEPLAASVAEEAIEPRSAADAGGNGLLVAQAPVDAMHADRVATDRTSPQPQASDGLSPLPSAIETGSIARVPEPDATRVARIVSDVRMRAGPSNGDAVLATIPAGRMVEVVGCRAWCEVIFAGERGWVYKGFVGSSPAPGEGRAGPAASSSQRAARPAE